MQSSPAAPPTIAGNLARIQAAIAAAARGAGRDPASVELVAVSKTHDTAAVTAALLAGQHRFGENRVQEAQGKFPLLRDAWTFRLHLIGPLQTNKARDAVRLADVIESLDRLRLADALADAVQREGRTPELLVQVNIGRETQKAGIDPDAADGFIASCCGRFGAALRGVMGIPPAEGDPGPHFAALAALARRHGLPVLSMGMSGDFEAAVRLGATRLRIGSAVFGARQPPPR